MMPLGIGFSTATFPFTYIDLAMGAGSEPRRVHMNIKVRGGLRAG